MKAILFKLFLLLFWSLNAHATDRLYVGVIQDSAGFFGASDGRLTGSAAGVYQCVFARSDIEIEAQVIPLKRGLIELESGRLDILAPLAKSEARDEQGDFAGPLIRAGVSTVTLHSAGIDVPPTEIPGLRYGILLGTIGKRFVPDSAVALEEVAAWSQLIEMLRLQRIDVAIMPTGVAKGFVAREAETFSTWEIGYLPASFYLSKKFSGSDVKRKLLEAVTQCREDNVRDD